MSAQAPLHAVPQEPVHGPDGYLVVALRWPDEENGISAWGEDHLVRFHGWTVEHARDGESVKTSNRHVDEHRAFDAGGGLVIPHTHHVGDAVREAIRLSEFSHALKDVLEGVLDVADTDVHLWGEPEVR